MGNSPPHNPPKGGCVGGENNSPLPDTGREAKAEWVRSNLPACAAFAAEIKSVFPSARMVYANEGGHVIGKAIGPGIRLDEIQVGPMALPVTDRTGKRK